MALIQTLQTHCLNCLLFPPGLCFWETDGLEHPVPFLYISVVCIFQTALPSIPGSPSPTRPQSGRDLAVFSDLSQALEQLRLGMSTSGRLMADVTYTMSRTWVHTPSTRLVSWAHLWRWSLFFAASLNRVPFRLSPSLKLYSHDCAWCYFHFNPFGKFPGDRERENANLGVYPTSSSFVTLRKWSVQTVR